jgi:hypothetical protein
MNFDVRVGQKSLRKVTELVGQNSLEFQSKNAGSSVKKVAKWTNTCLTPYLGALQQFRQDMVAKGWHAGYYPAKSQ